MGAVLSLAALLTYFYSRTISRPVGALMDAARQIEEGSFILDLVPTTRDELGALTATFVEMGQGLDRGRRLKDTFGKFVNKEIAERALNGELGLGGVRRQAVVFFSDIRRFTAISESLEPEEVVEFLNQYFTIMVGCIESTGGIVDKFIGDAVMAVWGVPEPKGQDGRAAADAALLMRRSLADFNRGRGGPRSPEISIGCALNSGPVLAGQIGSEKRMEYTVIGDTVNLTSRIEALTKPFGVDILVSESLRAELGADYRLEPMPLVAVKGKTEVQRVYALLGKADDPASPRSLAELRASLGIEALELDLDGVHDGAERKYDIKGGPRP
jgi:adenylate cyclase